MLPQERTLKGGNTMQKILAIILFIISFFTTGDMTKANVTLYKDLTAGDTTAVFVFENNTGKALSQDIKIETIEKEFLGQWVDVPFSQAILETAGKSSFETRVYPGEKATLHVDFITTVGGIPVQVPLTSGNYRITVSFKTDGYSKVAEGSVTADFTVAKAA